MTTDRWHCMLTWLQADQAPALPALPGRVHILIDDQPTRAELATRATDPATTRERAAATRRRNRELHALFLAAAHAHDHEGAQR